MFNASYNKVPRNKNKKKKSKRLRGASAVMQVCAGPQKRSLWTKRQAVDAF